MANYNNVLFQVIYNSSDWSPEIGGIDYEDVNLYETREEALERAAELSADGNLHCTVITVTE